MREVTCVVLAAGLGTRLGGDKLSLPYRGATMLDAVLDACAGFPCVAVVRAPTIAAVLRLRAPSGGSAHHMAVVINDEPGRGMSHSLWLANREVASERAIAVLLGDKPLVTPELVKRVVAVDDADVVYPLRDGIAGHPVVFSPRARMKIDGLRDGDTLQQLRDDPSLSRHALEIDDEGAYVDIDTEADYRGLRD